MKINLIYGPPGTGKTTYLLKILEEELKQLEPDKIAYVSFTKEGAYQGRNRAIANFGYKQSDFPYFKTLHSIAFKSANMSRSQVMGKNFYKIFSKKMGMNFTGFYTEDLRHNDDRYLFFNLLHRNNPKAASSYLLDLDIQKLKFVNSNYKRFKEFYSVYDFSDMIELFNKKNEALPVEVAIIDEAQDLTTLQWKMVWTAFKTCKRVYIAGDDDQAIYEWSGADVNYFLQIEGDISILDYSYRLPSNIVNFVKSITSSIKNRIEKNYRGTILKGEIKFILDLRELTITKNETWMFLSRNRIFLKTILTYIRDQGLVYSYNNELSVLPKNINAINEFERERKKGSISEIIRIKLRRFLKENIDLELPWYDNFNWDEDELKYYRDLIRTKVDIIKCNIRINTIHSVKGAEADNVVLLMDITKQIYSNLHNNPDSEFRVLYVACTRTRKNLFIVESQSTYEYTLERKLYEE